MCNSKYVDTSVYISFIFEPVTPGYSLFNKALMLTWESYIIKDISLIFYRDFKYL